MSWNDLLLFITSSIGVSMDSGDTNRWSSVIGISKFTIDTTDWCARTAFLVWKKPITHVIEMKQININIFTSPICLQNSWKN